MSDVIEKCSEDKVEEIYKKDIRILVSQLTQLLEKMPKGSNEILGNENTCPAAQPLFWIVKWVDYTNKYGFGYQLNDASVGVLFNDKTKLFMSPDGNTVHYVESNGNQKNMTTADYPNDLKKKMVLLSYYKRYMMDQLVVSGHVQEAKVHSTQIERLHFYSRSSRASVFLLTNGSVQFNFSDHIKIVLCPHDASVTYIDDPLRTYKFSKIMQIGCTNDLKQKLRYAQEKLMQLVGPLD